MEGASGGTEVTWLAWRLDPVIYGLAAWLAITVGFCVLVALGVAATWIVWWSISIRIRRQRL
jgi:hypothetical protein